MNATSSLLEMRDVYRRFPTSRGDMRDVLRGVTLRVARGDFLLITGPSGSGKTTLLNLMGLLDRASSGTVLFDGKDLGALREADCCRIRGTAVSMVFQQFHLLPYRTALENVLFRFRYLGVPAAIRRQRAEAALAETGLGDLMDTPARLLSAGEMQRVALARAVASEPALLLADEPTGNLDGGGAACVMDILHRLHARGMTIVMVTHDETLTGRGTRHLVCREGTLQ